MWAPENKGAVNAKDLYSRPQPHFLPHSHSLCVQPEPLPLLPQPPVWRCGEDAEAFAKELVDAFSAWCRRHRVGFRRADEGRTFVLEVGPAAAGELARFAGVNRVQREPQGTTKRHTSTATVAVISANAGLDAFDEEDVVWEAHRGGGKGGQHQNTTDSAVRSTHRPTGITVDISGRSQ